MLEGDIDKNGGAEISISYLQKVYATRKYGVVNMEKMKRIHITMGYRHWFNSKFSAGLAFFSAYSVGQGSVIHTDYPEGLRPDSSAKDITEYGFDFSLQHEPWSWSNGKYAVILDARYSMALTSKAKEDGNHFGLLAAFKYEVQEKGTDVSRKKSKTQNSVQSKGR